MRVIVTGAAQGIGECVARMLVKDGHALALADIQEGKVAAVAAELGAQPVRVDIADPASCIAMVAVAQQQLGGLDAVVQVAGLDAPPGSFDNTDEDLWRKVIDVDLSSPWWVAKAAVPALEASGGGRLIIISSVSAMIPDGGHHTGLPRGQGRAARPRHNPSGRARRPRHPGERHRPRFHGHDRHADVRA